MICSMNKTHSVSTPAAPDLDPDRADAEAAARILDRLVGMAMERAEAMQLQSLAAIKAGDAAKVRDLELSLDRLTRGIRRTLALKAHLAKLCREAAGKAAAEARARGESKSQRRQQVQHLVAYSMAADGDMDAGEVEIASVEILERLLDDPEIDAVLALAEHPIEEIVIRLCREMGIRAELVLPGFSPSGPYKTMDELWGKGAPEPRSTRWPGLVPGWDAAGKLASGARQAPDDADDG